MPSLASKMAPNVESRGFVRGTAPRQLMLLPDLEGLKPLLLPRDKSGDDLKRDISFWSERQRKKNCLQCEELRPYFPLPQVLDGLFPL